MQEENKECYFDTQLDQPEIQEQEVVIEPQKETQDSLSVYDQLITLIMQGDSEKIKELSQRTQEVSKAVNCKDNLQQNCLFKAVVLKDISKALEVTRLLLQLGASAALKDAHNQTPLYYAARDGKLDIVRLLVESVNNINEFDFFNQISLYYACREGRLEVAEYLVQKGANVQSKDKIGQTPLFYAAKEGHIEIAKMLISSGANPNEVDSRKQTPLKIAQKNNQIQMAEYLSEFSVKIPQSAQKDKKSKTVPKQTQEKPKVAISQQYRLTYTDNQLNQKELGDSEINQFSKDNPEVGFLLSNPEKIQNILSYQEQLEKMNWKPSALKIVNLLWKGNQAYFFHEPVDPIKMEVPNYFLVIKSPMDLGTIKKRLQNNFYENPQQFLDDIYLVYDNCILFNGEESFIGKIAVGFKNQIKTIIDTINFQFYLQIQEDYQTLKEEILQMVRQMMAECKYVSYEKEEQKYESDQQPLSSRFESERKMDVEDEKLHQGSETIQQSQKEIFQEQQIQESIYKELEIGNNLQQESQGNQQTNYDQQDQQIDQNESDEQRTPELRAKSYSSQTNKDESEFVSSSEESDFPMAEE